MVGCVGRVQTTSTVLPSTVDGKSICENLRILSGVTSMLQLAKVKFNSEKLNPFPSFGRMSASPCQGCTAIVVFSRGKLSDNPPST